MVAQDGMGKHSDAGELILSLRHPQHLTNRILSAGRHIELDFSAPEPPLGHELDAFTTRGGPNSAVSFDAGSLLLQLQRQKMPRRARLAARQRAASTSSRSLSRAPTPGRRAAHSRDAGPNRPVADPAAERVAPAGPPAAAGPRAARHRERLGGPLPHGAGRLEVAARGAGAAGRAGLGLLVPRSGPGAGGTKNHEARQLNQAPRRRLGCLPGHPRGCRVQLAGVGPTFSACGIKESTQS